MTVTDADWTRAIQRRHLTERLEVAEATNRVLTAAVYDAAKTINELMGEK